MSRDWALEWRKPVVQVIKRNVNYQNKLTMIKINDNNNNNNNNNNNKKKKKKKKKKFSGGSRWNFIHLKEIVLYKSRRSNLSRWQ